MTHAADDCPMIRPVTPEGAAEAFRLVFQGLPPEQSKNYVSFLTDEASAGRISTEGLLEARRNGRLVGAVWFEVQPGRAASIWPPRTTSGEPRSTAEALLSASSQLAARRGACIMQALLPVVVREDDAALRAAGFEPLAVLLYLGWEAKQLPEGPPVAAMEFETFDTAEPDRMIRLVEATYAGTLDCPALNGLRSIEDVLAGYRSAGVFSPQHWFYVRLKGRDVGCLLLADYPRENNVELVYMGLIPEARGNGWGRQICLKAQSVTRQMGHARLVVAVDVANRPAIAVYAAADFQAWDRRTVYLKRIVPLGVTPQGSIDCHARG